MRIPAQDGGTLEIPKADTVLEQLAHDIAYMDPRAMKPADQEKLRTRLGALGYQLPKLIADDESGFRSMSFLPIPGSEQPPVMAFRGTDDKQGLETDLDVEGVGTQQFAKHREQIRAELERMQKATGQRATLTGHSLGGALAERTMAEFPEMVGQGVTFQGAGIHAKIARDHAAKARAGGADPELRRYVSDHDLVDLSGAHLPGRTVSFDTGAGGSEGPGSFDGLIGGPIDRETQAHTSRLLHGSFKGREADPTGATTLNAAAVQVGREAIGHALGFERDYVKGHPAIGGDFDAYTGSHGSHWSEQDGEEIERRSNRREAEDVGEVVDERVTGAQSAADVDAALQALGGRKEGVVEILHD